MKGPTDVPILSKQVIDGYAEMILADFKPELIRVPGATPVEEFIEFYLGLRMDYAYLSTDNSVLGMIAFNDGMVEVFDEELRLINRDVKKGTIFLDNSLLENEQSGRCRFTLGHEPGHWIFHKHRYLHDTNHLPFLDNTGLPVAVSFKCLKKNVGRISQYRTFNTDEDWMEWQADYFSSALLMPKTPFLESVEQCAKEHSLSVEQLKQGCNAENFLDVLSLALSLAHTFDVSFQAATVRLYKLGFIPQDSLSMLFGVCGFNYQTD